MLAEGCGLMGNMATVGQPGKRGLAVISSPMGSAEVLLLLPQLVEPSRRLLSVPGLFLSFRIKVSKCILF